MEYEFRLLSDDTLNLNPNLNLNSNLDLVTLQNDDYLLLSYLDDVYNSKENIDKFYSYFFSDSNKENKENKENEELQSKYFVSVGIFEDISYLTWWADDKNLETSCESLRTDYHIDFWRKIKGDGNCFYRAVLINYLEILLVNSFDKKENLFFSFIKDLFFTTFPNEKEKFKKLTLTVFLQINLNISSFLNLNEKEHEINLFAYKCYDILYRAINKSDLIEKTLIYWLKIKLSNFLKSNLDLEINGLKLVQLIPGFELEDDMTYNKNTVFKYIDEDLERMNEFVEGYPLYITPLILGLKINIFHFDSKCKPIIFEMAKNKEISPGQNFLPTLLGEINILFRALHYDTFYSHIFVDKINSLYSNSNMLIIQGQLNLEEYREFKSQLNSESIRVKHSNNPLTSIVEANDNIILDRKNVNISNVIRQENKQTDSVLCCNCRKQDKNLIAFPCKDIFCRKCFQSSFDTFFNSRLKKGSKSMNTMKQSEISEALSKFRIKFIKCFSKGKCEREVPIKEFTKILDHYFSFVKESINVPNPKNNYCRVCQSTNSFIKLPDGKEVCSDCHKRTQNNMKKK